MRRSPVLAGGRALRHSNKASTALACAALVVVVGVAFWTGVVWIGERLLLAATAGM
jgi:hypothetical protein